MPDNKVLARVIALKDQAEAWVKENFADIQRIGVHGPDGSDRDNAIVRRVFLIVSAGVLLGDAWRTTLPPEQFP